MQFRFNYILVLVKREGNNSLEEMKMRLSLKINYIQNQTAKSTSIRTSLTYLIRNNLYGN